MAGVRGATARASTPARRRPIKSVAPTLDDDLPLLRTSERGSFKRCVQRWDWGSNQGLTLSGPPDIKLWFGSGWHLVMAHHYSGPGYKRGKDPMKVWREYVGEEQARLRVSSNVGDYSLDTFVEARTLGELMWEGYLERYGNDPSWWIIEPEQIGQSKIERVDKPGHYLLYSYTYDLVYRDEERNQVWLGEHKTAAQIDTKHLELDDQGGSYWAMKDAELRSGGALGKSERLKGIMYNFVRKAPKDDRPRNEFGKLVNKPVKRHYIEALVAAGEATEDDVKELTKQPLLDLSQMADGAGLTVLGDVSKNQGTDNFVRHPVYRTRAERNTQIKRIQNEFAVMNLYREGKLLPIKNATKDCSWDCSFYTMCILHEQGADWEEYRDAIYVKRDPYEPYRKSASGREQ